MSKTMQDNDSMWEEVRRLRNQDAQNGDFSKMTSDELKRYMLNMDAYGAVSLAKSPYCPADAYGELLDYPDSRVHEALAGVRGTIARYLSRQLMKTGNPEVWRVMAENPDACPTILAALTRSKDKLTAELAARNSSTPSDASDDYFYEKNSNRALGYE